MSNTRGMKASETLNSLVLFLVHRCTDQNIRAVVNRGTFVGGSFCESCQG